VAFRELTPGRSTGGFRFSRSLLQATADGRIARLSQVVTEPDCGPSIDQLAITTGVCAPLTIDSAVIGAVYVDARMSDEKQGYPDAAGFCHAVSRLASVALSSLKRVELEVRQQELDADLKIAQQAQAFLSPPQRGTIGRLRYVVQARPGRIVAGDLFDIFAIGRDKAAICLGDVTGQGMGSALLMTAILSHLRASLTLRGDPAAAVARVNAYITARSAGNMFASLWVGVFDQNGGTLKYVDAGHGHWLVKRSGQPPSPPPGRGSLLIGIEPDFRYTTRKTRLNDGDRLILYSDGMIERTNAAGEDFGARRLAEVIAASTSMESDVTASFAALKAFVGDAGLADDTTLASVEVCAAPRPSDGASEGPIVEVDRAAEGGSRVAPKR
jgi:serine phosphatase RsbU (regulator of sigma subunit)